MFALGGETDEEDEDEDDEDDDVDEVEDEYKIESGSLGGEKGDTVVWAKK